MTLNGTQIKQTISLYTTDTHIVSYWILDLYQILYPAKLLQTVIMHSNVYIIRIYACFLFCHDTIAQGAEADTGGVNSSPCTVARLNTSISAILHRSLSASAK